MDPADCRMDITSERNTVRRGASTRLRTARRLWLLDSFMHLGRTTCGIDGLLVVRMPTASRGMTWRGLDDRRDHKADGPDDHEDDPHRRESKAVPLVGHRPLQDRSRSNCHGAETHAGQTHIWCLHLVVWSVTTTFRGFAGCVVGTQADDVLKTTLRPTDEIDDRNNYQDQDECSKADVHSSRLSWVTRCATHRIRQHTLR